jgi:hypothetical protein
MCYLCNSFVFVVSLSPFVLRVFVVVLPFCVCAVPAIGRFAGDSDF